MSAVSAPSHLSLFMADPVTGLPVSHLPVFAEIAVPRIVTPPAPDPRFEEYIGEALTLADQTVDDDADLFTRVQTTAGQALVESLHRQSWAILLTDMDLMRSFFGTVCKRVLQEGGWTRFAEIDPAALKGEFSRVFREEAAGHGWLILPPAGETEALWSEPLGVLASDHAGYLSFDLNRLRPEVRAALADTIERRRNDPNAKSKVAIWVHPYGYDKPQDALAQARFTDEAVVARFLVRPQELPTKLANMGLRALQNPALIDWFLSPASFASSPQALTGGDGCEQLLPANLALAEFGIRQVVRITDPQDGDFQVPDGHRAAYVDEYKVSWYALGHSLGEIKYSLPLAPGESVKLAVVDWSWDSLTHRDEKTKLTEDILHQTHRDRTITETVVAGVKELQHGSSFMAGGALSAGAGGKLGPIGAAAGSSFSMGGSTATSDGSRDLAAENVQKLMDSFSQASSSQREINSTVVIQARQEEKESVQTRTFTNYNHSHTLTVLYYEVLRHYRVTVEWVRRRRAVLMKLPALVSAFDADALIANRSVLEPALLDQSLKPAFDALEKRESLKALQIAQGTVPKPAQAQWWEGDAEFDMFEIGIWSKDVSPDKIITYVITADQVPNEKRFELHYLYKGEHFDVYNMNSGERFKDEWEQWTLARIFDHVQQKFVSVKWKDIVGFQFEKWGDDAPWRIDFITINAFSKGGFRMGLTDWHVDVDLYFAAREPAVQTFTRIKLPGWPPPTPIPAVLSPDQLLTQDELYAIKKLEKHIDLNKDYYGQVLMLAVDPASIAMQFEKTKWDPAGTAMVADHVDPYPLEVFGSYVAYPLAKQPAINDALVAELYAAIQSADPARRQWALDQLATLSKGELRQVTERLTLLASKSQRLITLPTRGVFAEGKLGHCNVSEEIDNTRFWKWDEHPIPVAAPEIAPVNVVQPVPQQTEGTTPTGFPQSLVNIVNPSPAPDPHGLTAALTLLGTANIFRDMSGQAQVTDLLKKLSDNSVKVAEISAQLAGVKPSGGGSGSGSGSSGSGSSAGGGAGSAGGTSSGGAGAAATRTPLSPSEQHDRIQVVRNAVAKGNITPEEGNKHIGNILAFGLSEDAAGGTGVGRLIVTGNRVAARAFFPLKIINGETMFIIGSEGLPDNVIEQIFAVPANPVGAGGSVIQSQVGPGLIRVLAARGGVAGLMAQVPEHIQVKPEGVLYSVPLFVEIAASEQALDAIFNAWNLSDERVRIVVMLRETLLGIQGANIRFVQTGFAGSSNPFAQRTLPPQYQLNGEARQHLTIVTLEHTAPSGELIDLPQQGSEGEPLIGGMAWINLKHASEGTAPFNEAFKALLAKLAANPADAALRTFLTTFVTRFLASTILRTTTHMVFGINPGTPSIQECTGFELAQGANAGDPASYTDRGLEAMRPRALAAKLLRETFPLPPDFS